MNFKILGKTVDLRTGTHVIYCKCSISEYLNIVNGDFENFSIQRKRESHKAYKRLKDDLKNGALLPSITLALKHHLVEKVLPSIEDNKALTRELSKPGNVDILDGLQRTYIIQDLVNDGHTFNPKQEVLLEYWLEGDIQKLIYRMIVLNAGQKAMSIRHQVELLFMSLRETISNEIDGVEIFLERDGSRRTQPHKYALGTLAASYQAFLTRSTEIDKNDVVSSNLVKDTVLDASEEEHTENFSQFINYFKTFKEIDHLAWNFYEKSFNDEKFQELQSKKEDLDNDELIELNKLMAFKNAKVWFGSENVMLGFFCALGQAIGTSKKDRVDSALQVLLNSFQEENDDPFGIYKYERYKGDINPRKSNIGNATRKLILNGFKEYIRDEGETPFTNCWALAID